MKVSVLINVFNGEEFVATAIKSVLGQTYSQIEIIVVDNASSDRTKEVCKEFRDQIKFICLDQHLLLGAARNYGLRNCSGEVIAFLDADDLWVPEKVERLVTSFANPLTVLAYSNVKFTGMRDDHLSDRQEIITGSCKSDFFRTYPIVMSASAVRSESLLQLDRLFDERLEILEDFDLFIRLASIGNVDYVNETLVVVDVRPNSTGNRDPMRLLNEFKQVGEREAHTSVEISEYNRALKRLILHQIQLAILTRRRLIASEIATLFGTWPIRLAVKVLCGLPPQVATKILKRQIIQNLAKRVN